MRKRVLSLAVAAAIVSPVWAIAPAASATEDCATLQNTYAAASAAALKRAGQLQISDEDFRVLRDELQRLGADGELTSQELVPLATTNAAARKLSLNFTAEDQTLIQNLIKSYNTYVAVNCDDTAGDPDDKTSTDVPSAPATSATPTPTASPTTTPAPSSGGGQVVTVPNDAPETGDGSYDVYATPESITAQIVAYVVASLVGAFGIFTALRRSDH